MKSPTDQSVKRAVRQCLHHEAVDVRRIPMGRSHFVFTVQLDSGEQVIVRIARADRAKCFEGFAYWRRRLARVGVPVPRVLSMDLTATQLPWPVMFLEHVPGDDLCNVYPRLTSVEKRSVVGDLLDIRLRVRRLPAGPGFGGIAHYDDTCCHPRWSDVLWEYVTGALDHLPHHEQHRRPVEHIRSALHEFDAEFDRIPPLPYLIDATHQNVMIDGGRVTAIVDLDEVGFGDALYPLGAARAGLLARGPEADCITHVAAPLCVGPLRRRIFDLYSAIACLKMLAPSPLSAAGPPGADSRIGVRLRGLLDTFATSAARKE